MMAMAGIPGVTSEAVKYIQEKLESDLSDDEASRTFTRCASITCHGNLKKAVLC